MQSHSAAVDQGEGEDASPTSATLKDELWDGHGDPPIPFARRNPRVPGRPR